jgi:hypothetical protein
MAASESGVGFSGHTLDKATKAKVTLENYYSNLIAQHIERKKRFVITLEFFVTWVGWSHDTENPFCFWSCMFYFGQARSF